ncbi:transcription cofactor vestigial-like protein 3 [Astyanax mexicanus]|uniref:Transcription cofactor vestigial-like protein 3 n=1 Tax=Astyanax mexicanus TaxID=7994 RepID=A0A8B9JEJ4_ASTMX|nr:transcription cofactor vestigial-like protein 3 [Astyanax mexicanus]
MSCLDVMYHQNYGAHHYLPATSVAAAAAYKAAYYHHHHHHHQQQQQKKFSAYSKMQGSLDMPVHCGQSKPAEKPRAEPELQREEGPAGVEEARCKETQPAEAEYLSARCVLFTYFRGDIGDVVDEHFSRALSQPSAFTNDTKSSRHASGEPWKDGGSPSEAQCGSLSSSSLWSSSYPSQTTSPCISSVHTDFPATAFHTADSSIWSGHSLAQPGLPPPSALTDSWPYALGSQGAPGYPHIHEMYPHMHPRHPHPHPHPHAHPMLHHTHGTALDPRFSPLLLPGMRPSCSPSSNTEGVKTELEPSASAASSWPAASFHGSVDIYDTALDQDKPKASVWF